MSRNDLPPTRACLPYDPRTPNPYGYRPSLAPGVVLVVLFGISAGTHAGQSLYYRTPWHWAFFLGAFFECVGWIARVITHKCAYSVTMFKMQLAVLISGNISLLAFIHSHIDMTLPAPAFTQAGIYAVLWAMVSLLGRHTSPLPPKVYIITFLIVDVVCLSLQAIGGGLAGAAFSKKTSTKPGTDTMVVGIVAQLVSTCVFALLLNYAFVKGSRQIRANRNLTLLSGATLLSIACMIIRGIYRSIELLQGWRGYLITTERYAIVLEGCMMIVAVAIFNIFHPGRLIAEAKLSMEESPEAERVASNGSEEFKE